MTSTSTGDGDIHFAWRDCRPRSRPTAASGIPTAPSSSGLSPAIPIPNGSPSEVTKPGVARASRFATFESYQSSQREQSQSQSQSQLQSHGMIGHLREPYLESTISNGTGNVRNKVGHVYTRLAECLEQTTQETSRRVNDLAISQCTFEDALVRLKGEVRKNSEDCAENTERLVDALQMMFTETVQEIEIRFQAQLEKAIQVLIQPLKRMELLMFYNSTALTTHIPNLGVLSESVSSPEPGMQLPPHPNVNLGMSILSDGYRRNEQLVNSKTSAMPSLAVPSSAVSCSAVPSSAVPSSTDSRNTRANYACGGLGAGGGDGSGNGDGNRSVANGGLRNNHYKQRLLAASSRLPKCSYSDIDR